MATLQKNWLLRMIAVKISITALISNLMRYVAVVEGNPDIHVVARLAC